MGVTAEQNASIFHTTEYSQFHCKHWAVKFLTAATCIMNVYQNYRTFLITKRRRKTNLVNVYCTLSKTALLSKHF